MKVILKEDVVKVGRRYEVKEVKPGFGRNFLLARRLADLATEGNLRQVEMLKKRAESQQVKRQAESLKNLQTLEGKIVTLTARANEQGHLFEAIHAPAIAQAIKDQVGLDLNPDWLKVAKPIKALGEWPLTVEHEKHTVQFILAVVGNN